MSSEWDTLPLLPLNCILQQLSTKDALSAMSTCAHWRTGVLLYEGHKETLKLRVKQFEKSLFVTRVFRRRARSLHVQLDGSPQELDRFMDCVLPQFLDTENLRELVFIGPNYRQHSQTNRPIVKLKRIIPDSLLYKHRQSLTRFALLGCALDSVDIDNDAYIQNLEFNSRVLKYSKAQLCGEALLCNSLQLALQHLILDYEQVPTKWSLGVMHSACLRRVTLNVKQRPTHKLRLPFADTTQVGVNIIGVPYTRFEDVIENVLVEDLQLVSLKVLFCDAIYAPLIKHVVGRYKSTLRQLVWSDRPKTNRPPLIVPDEGNSCNVNPFIVLCWQCANLRRLVIHGYWLWQYDLLGFVRLSSSLQQLEVSSVYAQPGRFASSEQTTFRVLSTDHYRKLDDHYVDQINQHTGFPWRPTPWARLPAGLALRATALQRTDYLVAEMLDYSLVPL